ncbi:MAG: hypothetical protein WCO14_05000, partial [bacterium]
MRLRMIARPADFKSGPVELCTPIELQRLSGYDLRRCDRPRLLANHTSIQAGEEISRRALACGGKSMLDEDLEKFIARACQLGAVEAKLIL